jgi:galactokinase
MTPTDLARPFRLHFAGAPDFYAVAPGRVNLIGEHTDYNEGFVLPVAIDRQVVYAVRARDDGRVRLVSREFEDTAEFSLDDPGRDAAHPWADYVAGVAWALQREGYSPAGFDAVVAGDVPVAAGLSSSAAMEVGAATAFCHLSGWDIEPARFARICRRAENDFVGVNCGIMDMFVSRLAKRGHALFLDCRDLSYEHVPVPLDGACLLIANTNVQRALVTSEYNARRSECERGVEVLRAFVPGARSLRGIPPDVFALRRDELPETTAQRCGYVIAENARVEGAVRALRAGDMDGFGALMYASHEGLRDDYEVSCRELDTLVDIARSVHGVYGSRMTGAGFGGCTVTLVADGALDTLCRKIADEYPARTGLVADCYVCRADGGAHILPA